MVVLPYDEKLQTFNIDETRKHHEFLYLLQEHKKDMEQPVTIQGVPKITEPT